MKEYPITEETLDNIGVMKKSSAGSFAVASGAFATCISSAQALCFAGKDVKPAVWGAWVAIAVISVIVAIGALLVGLWFNGRERSVLQHIKDETTHAQP